MANKNRSVERERFWRDVLARFAQSGRQVREFCRDERLSESAFYAWRRTIAERDREAADAKAPQQANEPQAPHRRPSSPAFLPVVVRQDVPAAVAPAIADIRVELRGGRVLRLPESMPAERVAAIVIALESCATAEAGV